jgi:hypothetical protein
MTNAENILVPITCLVGIVCIIAVQIKKGIIMGSIRSELEGSAKKYIARSEKQKPFYIYLSLAFIVSLLVALLFTRDLESIAIFTGSNLFTIGYFLNYFVLLEPKDESK